MIKTEKTKITLDGSFQEVVAEAIATIATVCDEIGKREGDEAKDTTVETILITWGIMDPLVAAKITGVGSLLMSMCMNDDVEGIELCKQVAKMTMSFTESPEETEALFEQMKAMIDKYGEDEDAEDERSEATVLPFNRGHRNRGNGRTTS